MFSTIGTYVGLRGGNDYPTLIRKTEAKPIRVFLQDGSNDNNGYGGNWFLANQEMLSAFEFSGYDVKNVWGDGAHNSKHGGAILPDALRWLWRDYPAPIRPAGPSKQLLANLLVPGEGWQLVGEGYRFTEGPAANAKGEVFFTDIPNNRIHKVGLDGKVSIFKEDTGSANGLMFGPDGKLYACQNGRKRIVAYDMDGKETVVAEGLDSNDLTITHKGEIYVSDPPNKQVWFINANARSEWSTRESRVPTVFFSVPIRACSWSQTARGKWCTRFRFSPTDRWRTSSPTFICTWQTPPRKAAPME